MPAALPVLTADLDICNRASTTVAVSYKAVDDVRTGQLEYTFKNAGHRVRATMFAAVVRDIRGATGAEMTVLLSDAAFDALAPLARGELAPS